MNDEEVLLSNLEKVAIYLPSWWHFGKPRLWNCGIGHTEPSLHFLCPER